MRVRELQARRSDAPGPHSSISASGCSNGKTVPGDRHGVHVLTLHELRYRPVYHLGHTGTFFRRQDQRGTFVPAVNNPV